MYGSPSERSHDHALCNNDPTALPAIPRRRDGTVVGTRPITSNLVQTASPGSFRFVAAHPERAPASSPLITLDGGTPRDGVVITMAVGAVIHGHVVDAQHRAVASARVRIGVASGALAMFEAPREASTDATGGFEIRGLPRNQLLAVARHELGSSHPVPIDTTRLWL